MKSVGGRGKIKRTSSANITNANTNTNANANANSSKSRPVADGGSNSINRKPRYSSRKTVVPRKWRKPAVLPCSLNECHAVEDEEDGAGIGTGTGTGTAVGNGGGNDDESCEQQEQNGDKETGSGVDPSIKTVESALEGDKEGPRLSEHLGGDTDGAIEDAQRDVDGPDSQSGDNDGSEISDADSADDGGGGGSTAGSSDVDGGGGQEGADGADGAKKVKEGDVRHIHPCICDLSTKAQARIKAHIRKRELFELRHTQRLESIDAELRAIEEEIARKQQEELEQEELFGDKYEVVGKKKKRMKRSARRASMVSLGVKQVINWKKSPKIKVRHNQASNLRKNFTAYCGDRPVPLPDVKRIGYGQSPKIPVRVTKAASLRGEANSKKKQYYIDNEDKRPIFDVSPFY